MHVLTVSRSAWSSSGVQHARHADLSCTQGDVGCAEPVKMTGKPVACNNCLSREDGARAPGAVRDDHRRFRLGISRGLRPSSKGCVVGGIAAARAPGEAGGNVADKLRNSFRNARTSRVKSRRRALISSSDCHFFKQNVTTAYRSPPRLRE